MAKPGACANCGREIHDKWTLCRPCAVAHGRGRAPYTEPCTSFVPDPYWPLIGDCFECGFGGALHPGTGPVASTLVSI